MALRSGLFGRSQPWFGCCSGAGIRFGGVLSTTMKPSKTRRSPEKAMYGLGKLTKKGIPILANRASINDEGTYYSKSQNRWYNHFWQQGRAFNNWISKAMSGPRLSRSNHVCGGCLALHRGTRRLSFDSVGFFAAKTWTICSTCACTVPTSGSTTSGR